ncbi:MAG: helix-turn-helix transcriptional regulator [Candidatus Thiodiazotropha sp.]|nr:helix-turn-helix transcriptional regulator [Candidatus Thiodiazotropha sp.]MCM8919818.1 helix-turn-helix transcriptional regulator [Candidatus Thiodiazotropha sp.]MCU7872947.1 helix-turn-helix transcriptional regulator [Candidatus Thiodiazotropha sp. (ex Lucinoma borealis)]MCU7884583.1 helix-turn-helix transcriptional regulator [Candidatus Thiodiazotropha sp. (ex Lucinoma annulata)]
MTMNVEKRTVDPSTHVGHVIDPGRPILSVSEERPSAELVSKHAHLRGQLLYAIRGVMKTTTEKGAWLVPPAQAVWIPPGEMHEVEMTQSVSLRSIYVDPAYIAKLPASCCVLRVTPLLQALILEATTIGNDYYPNTSEARLMMVIVDQLQKIEQFPFHLPFSDEPRIRKIINALVTDPADTMTLAQWATRVGASERTLGRLFLKHLGMSFGNWRRRLRLLEAMDRLASGVSVTEVAFELGYGSPSAFIAMFRENLGEPPARFFSETDIPAGAA